MVEETIQHGRGDGGVVVEDASPVLVRLVGGSGSRNVVPSGWGEQATSKAELLAAVAGCRGRG